MATSHVIFGLVFAQACLGNIWSMNLTSCLGSYPGCGVIDESGDYVAQNYSTYNELRTQCLVHLTDDCDGRVQGKEYTWFDYERDFCMPWQSRMVVPRPYVFDDFETFNIMELKTGWKFRNFSASDSCLMTESRFATYDRLSFNFEQDKNADVAGTNGQKRCDLGNNGWLSARTDGYSTVPGTQEVYLKLANEAISSTQGVNQVSFFAYGGLESVRCGVQRIHPVEPNSVTFFAQRKRKLRTDFFRSNPVFSANVSKCDGDDLEYAASQCADRSFESLDQFKADCLSQVPHTCQVDVSGRVRASAVSVCAEAPENYSMDYTDLFNTLDYVNISDANLGAKYVDPEAVGPCQENIRSPASLRLVQGGCKPLLVRYATLGTRTAISEATWGAKFTATTNQPYQLSVYDSLYYHGGPATITNAADQDSQTRSCNLEINAQEEPWIQFRGVILPRRNIRTKNH